MEGHIKTRKNKPTTSVGSRNSSSLEWGQEEVYRFKTARRNSSDRKVNMGKKPNQHQEVS